MRSLFRASDWFTNQSFAQLRWLTARFSNALIIALFFAIASAAHAAPRDQQQKLNETLADLAESKKEQAALAKKQAAIEAEMAKLQTHATELAERLQVSERRVTSEEKALSAVSGKLDSRQKEFEARKADYAATVITMLRMKRMPMTAVYSASPEEFGTLMQTASVLEKTNRAVAAKANALRKDMGELKELRGETAIRRTRTNAETEALEKEKAALEKAIKARQKLQSEILVDKAKAEEQVARLSRESASLQELLSKLEREPKAATPPKKTARAVARGSMSAPVAGEAIHRFGEAKNGGETYRGMVIRARPGATVVAPNDGQVVFTGPFRDYGNMLLIKHPGGYISLIAGVGRVTTAMNQNVGKGEPVAVMGASKDPEVYVELRDSSAKPVDPADWFANLSTKMSQR